MARPRKLETSEMLKIVDSYFESNGNSGALKYSLFEEYATSLGLSVKAYDFRRNEAVRRRVEELRGTVSFNGQQAIAYKGIDVDAFLNRNHTREAFRNSLLELDEIWRRVYDRAALLSRHNTELLKESIKTKQENEALNSEKSELKAICKAAQMDANAFMLENRYLKRMLKQYLYPAIANQILINENVLTQADTEVTSAAMTELADTGLPSPFSQSVSADTVMISREASLLQRMKKQIRGGNNDA